jgi:hypothetical protein
MNTKSIWESSNSEDLGLDTNMIQCWFFPNSITYDKPIFCEVHQNLTQFEYHVQLQAPIWTTTFTFTITFPSGYNDILNLSKMWSPNFEQYQADKGLDSEMSHLEAA